MNLRAFPHPSLRSTPPRRRGATLMEAVIALGALAVAMPLVLGTLAGAGKSGLASRAETRSPWMVRQAVDEFNATLTDCNRFTTRERHTGIPPGTVWALKFGDDGTLLGTADLDSYQSGVETDSPVQENPPARYLARLETREIPATSERPQLLQLLVKIEWPANVKASRRSVLEFHSIAR